MSKMNDLVLDIIVPLYNDCDVLAALCEAVFSEINGKFKSFRLILVDDGSIDSTFENAMEMREKYQSLEVIRLAGNFGQHRAILAGLRSTNADIIAVMDSDLQDRPEHILIMVEKMLEDDTPMAIARRASRNDSLWKKIGSRTFATLSNLSLIHI